MTSGRASDRSLAPGERRLLVVLGLPGLALALAITTVSTYLPVVASRFTGSATVVGLLIASEGILALFLPLLVGAWSDRRTGALGGRLPFMLAATPVIAITLVLMALAGGLALMAAWVVVFFAAYFVVYEPYRALYPDLVEEEIAGRAQSGQAVARGAGTAAALGLGGLLLSIGDVVPFAVAAAVLMVAIGLFAHLLLTRGHHGRSNGNAEGDVRSDLRRVRELVRSHRALRPYLAANALWELALAAIKTFVVLYITAGLGYSLSAASGIIGAGALVIVLGAVTSGRLADRYGTARVMRFALVVYGAGLLIPFATSDPTPIVAALPLIAFGGGVLMALPYALLMPMMPKDDHGTVTGFYAMSRGLGIMLGPLLAGAAIDAGLTPAGGAEGYPAIWGLAAIAILASLPLLRRVERAQS